MLGCLGDASLHLDFAVRGVGVGPPTAFRRNGASAPWVSLPGPTGVILIEGDEPPKRQPLWLCRVCGRCRDRGHDCHVDLSCGRRSYTHSSSTPPRLVRSGC